ncbi:MAG: hypothetical protein ACPGO5_00435 [Patescibacteria group bacterium]
MAKRGKKLIKPKKKEWQGMPPLIAEFMHKPWWIVIANPTSREAAIFHKMAGNEERLTLAELEKRLPKANLMIHDKETHDDYVRGAKEIDGFTFLAYRCKGAIVF